MASKPKVPAKRLVWRITPNAPMGEWVDPTKPAPKPPAAPAGETEPGNWNGSSFDLLRGSEVNDDPTTQPDTLWDDFFGPDADKPPPS